MIEYSEKAKNRILEIANDEKFRDNIHPNVARHLNFEWWMAEVFLHAQYQYWQEQIDKGND